MKYRSITAVGYGDRQEQKEVNDPFLVACPRCGSRAGFECQTKSGFRSEVHADRWKAIGVSRPSLEDIDGAWWLTKQRKMRILMKNQAHERLENMKIQLNAAKQAPPGPERNERIANLRARLLAAREQARAS